MNITSSTSKLKRLILNQRVHVTIQPSMNKEFYLVELKLSNQQSVNQLLLSNDPLPVVCSLRFHLFNWFLFDLDSTTTTSETCGVRRFFFCWLSFEHCVVFRVLTMRPLLATEELPPPPNLLTNRSTPPTRSPQLQSEEDRSRAAISGSRPPSRKITAKNFVIFLI